MSSRADLEALLVLGDLDTRLERLRERRAGLPERAELGEIDAEALRLRSALYEADAALAAASQAAASAEATLAEEEARARGIKNRLYGGQVSASRELQALAGELESAEARVLELEERALELLEAKEQAERSRAELLAQATALAKRRKDVLGRLSSAEAELDREAASLSEARAQAANQVPQALLGAYQAISARLGSAGVARLSGGRCQGCHLGVSAMEADHARHLAEGGWATCEQCGRVLVP